MPHAYATAYSQLTTSTLTAHIGNHLLGMTSMLQYSLNFKLGMQPAHI